MDEMKFIKNLNNKITDIINIVISESITNEMYNAYVKYVGKFEALPKSQLDIENLRDKFGNLIDIKFWPIKSTEQSMISDFERAIGPRKFTDDPDDPFIKSIQRALE